MLNSLVQCVSYMHGFYKVFHLQSKQSKCITEIKTTQVAQICKSIDYVNIINMPYAAIISTCHLFEITLAQFYQSPLENF